MPKHGTEAEEMEIMPEVELSSDSEQEDDDEVSLIVLKRPPLVKRTIQDLEVVSQIFIFSTCSNAAISFLILE